jgi:hypothetical protein
MQVLVKHPLLCFCNLEISNIKVSWNMPVVLNLVSTCGIRAAVMHIETKNIKIAKYQLSHFLLILLYYRLLLYAGQINHIFSLVNNTLMPTYSL